MTRDDIIRMAREAGLATHDRGRPNGYAEYCSRIERFASLVAAAEREACAKLARQVGEVMAQRYGDGAECITTGEEISDAIRARGAADPT